MTDTTDHPAVELLKARGAVLKTCDFVAVGINRMALHRLAANGSIERVGNGMFRLPEIDMYADWAGVAARYPEAVFSTLSAAVFHRTTQEMPGWMYVSLPRQSGLSKLAGSLPSVKVIRWADRRTADPLSYGIEEHVICGVKVRITDPERTLVDMFRFSTFNPSMRDDAVHVSEEAFMDCMQKTIGRKEFSISRLDAWIAKSDIGSHFDPILKNALYTISSIPLDYISPGR